MRLYPGKRLLDLALVVVLVPAWLPLFAIIALLVRVRIGSPVFFRQMRPGLHGRSFALLKFRTMREAKVKCEGVNSCKGQSDCKSARNSCNGQNGCSGRGFKEMSQAECDAAKARLKDKKG